MAALKKEEGGCTRTKVGVTVGLSQTCQRPNKPEQVYVYREDSIERPVTIEGWVGYERSQRMTFTRRQAKELIPLLLDALDKEQSDEQ